MKTIENINVKDKRVLVRSDLNISIDGRLENKSILKEATKTINYLKDKGAKIILMSELGQPGKEERAGLSMENVAVELEKILDTHIEDVENVTRNEAMEATTSMIGGEIVLLENLGFYKEEFWNDDEFATMLARLADIYVDDNFRISNKEYTSNVAITRHLPSFAGLALKEELDKMKSIANRIDSPFVMLIGGTYPEKKLPIIDRFLPVADTILVAGEIALAFLKAQGHQVGGYTISETAVDMAKQILLEAKEENCNIVCPVDFLVAQQVSPDAERKEVSADSIPEDWFTVDIGPRTFEEFNKYIYDAQSILWNGPVGIYEIQEFEYGTRSLAQSMASTDATTIAGGTDTVSVINKYGKTKYIDILSYGGDSFLSYLKAEALPGIKALD